MTNFEKLKLVVGQIQFMTDDGIIDEESCGDFFDEIHSTCEILIDANPKWKEDLRRILLVCSLNELR